MLLRTLLVVIAFLTILVTSQLVTAYAIAYFPPPLKQIRAGTLQENVTCTEGLQLVFKSTNGNPACVKSSTAEKLVERGWALVTSSIDSFEECVEAGNPVMESYPRQCRTTDGRHFVEEIG